MSNALNELILLEKDARAFGFDWPNKETIIEQAISECKEIKDAIHQNESPTRIQEEIGDLLHTAVSLCIFSGFEVEDTLAKINQKFATRMNNLKKETKNHGLFNLKGQTTEFSLKLWQKIKKIHNY